MKLMTAIALAFAVLFSTGAMAKPEGGGDGGSGTFDRAMAHNDAAMAAYRAGK